MKNKVLALLLVTLTACSAPPSKPDTQKPVDITNFLGRWDVTVESPDGAYGSWFEITANSEGPVGRFVSMNGSARDIETLNISGDQLEFSLPVQYEPHPEDISFVGTYSSDTIRGTTNAADGSTLRWTAVRAPTLERVSEPKWGEPIQLFNGTNLSGWHVQTESRPNKWVAKDGLLMNTDEGTDLVSDQKFDDFRLQMEFKYPQGSNSGLYLRGRYEVQIQDDFGKEPSSVYMGGVYGFLTPTKNVAKKAGEWQSYDITLVGRKVTIVLNGETIIEEGEIPGITGEALDSNEGEPGPIMLQGTHGPITFRNIVLTPAG